ncbi:hypothetical protein [Paracoccus aminophilus]|uniref:Uncharacterized protein n=1 Tax=Paracoccus aminophilus JCM 7686 TaxID=1367847 RepID=S5YWK5_PARAH|nr:hypothetical protein [Paracoccus aminophilus]AGT09576.1 hypothetical protein JCM7686_2508 [Paracoccus aminophilus JCM 7686]
MRQSDCTRNCWIVGAISGLVVMLFVSGIGETHWLGGLFLALVTCLLGGALLIWFVCEGAAPAYDVEAGLLNRRRAMPGKAVTPVETPLAAAPPVPAAATVSVAPAVAKAPAPIAPTPELASEPVAAPEPVLEPVETLTQAAPPAAARDEDVAPKDKAGKDKGTKAKDGKDKSAKDKSKDKAKAKKQKPDDLKRINGIGPKVEEALNKLGVSRFVEIAAWGADEIADYTKKLGRRGARIESDDWVGQAKQLSEGADD